jgi:hypothetical protein
MQEGAEWNIPQIGWSTMVADDPIGEHCEGMRRVSKKLTRAYDPKASTAVGMIQKGENAPIGNGLFQRRELACFGTKRLILGDCRRGEQAKEKAKS